MAISGKWNPSQIRARELETTWPSADVLGGMVLIGPTSVSSTGNAGASASIVGNGTVQFQYCETVSIDGVFSASFENYLVIWNAIDITSSSARSTIQFRRNRITNSTAGSYSTQELTADGTSTSAARNAAFYGWCFPATNENYSGGSIFISGPYLTGQTTWRSLGATGYLGGTVLELSGTHNINERFDGFVMGRATFSYSGSISVYGLG